MELKRSLLLLIATAKAFQTGSLPTIAKSHSTKLFQEQDTSSTSTSVSTTWNRRQFAISVPTSIASLLSNPLSPAFAEDDVVTNTPVEVIPNADIKKLFNEARAMEGQGNIPAAQRIYAKVTKVSPRVSSDFACYR